MDSRRQFIVGSLGLVATSLVGSAGAAGQTAPQQDAEAGAQVDAVVGELVDGGEMQLVVEDVQGGVDLGEFVEPGPGNEFLAVTVALQNASEEFVTVSNLLQTRVRDDEGNTYDLTLVGGDEPTFNDGQFAPGEVERGALHFEVPTDATGLALEWDFGGDRFEDVDRAVVDLEQTVEGEPHLLEQDLLVDVHEVGSTVSHDGVSVTVHDVRAEDSLGTFAEPAEGNEYVLVDLSIDNQSDEDQLVSTVLQMLAKDGAGWSYQEAPGAAAELDRSFDEAAPIQVGETRRGEVAYEIPVDTAPLYWVFEFSLWTEGDKTFWELRAPPEPDPAEGQQQGGEDGSQDGSTSGDAARDSPASQR